MYVQFTSCVYWEDYTLHKKRHFPLKIFSVNMTKSAVFWINFRKILKQRVIIFNIVNRGGSRAAATSKMECFVTTVNGWKPLIIVTKHFILDVATALDPPLVNGIRKSWKNFKAINMIKKTTKKAVIFLYGFPDF